MVIMVKDPDLRKTGVSSEYLRGAAKTNEWDRARQDVSSLWDTHYEQFSPGPVQIETHFVAMNTLAVYRKTVSTASRIVGKLRGGLLAFVVPGRSLFTNGRWWMNHHPQDGIPVVGGMGTLDMIIPAGMDWVIVVFQEEAFRSRVERITGLKANSFAGVSSFIRTNGIEKENIEQVWMKDMVDLLVGCSHLKAETFFETVADSFIERLSLPLQFIHDTSQRKALVSRALRTIAAERHKISIAELCEQLHASKRSLEYAFLECLGIAPATYMKIHRLNLCRVELSQSPYNRSMVRTVARRHGFSSSGNFAQNYFRFFGELPSEALRRPLPDSKPLFDIETVAR